MSRLECRLEFFGMMVALVAVIGFIAQCALWSSQGHAEWKARMDFAYRTGGVYDPHWATIRYPDGKILYLSTRQ